MKVRNLWVSLYGSAVAISVSPYYLARRNHDKINCMATLYYYHDPMCSWCWGYRPTLQKLFSSLPEGVTRTNIVGGLAPDSDQPMPEAQRAAIAGYWRRIEDMLGAEFNHDFWTRCEPRDQLIRPAGQLSQQQSRDVKRR